MNTRTRQSRRDGPGERSLLQPERHLTPSYGTGPPSYEPLPSYPGGGYQTYQAHPSPQDSSPPRFKMNTVTTVRLIFLVVLTQAVAFILSYHLPTKYGEYSRAASRMHDQECAMRREAAHLEDERIVHQGESDRLEKERLALESATHRSEQESLRLEQDKKLMEDERLMLEQEKEEWKKERGRWEKSREDRVPQGAFWASLWPAPDCRAYGRREYWGTLENIPEDWTDMEACTNMPAEIKGVYVRRPDRCGYVEGSSHIHGFWMVDQDEVDCKPWHADATDKGCTNRGSSTRRIEAWVVGINDKPEQDWRLLCESTPFTWNHVTYRSPSHCMESITGKKYAMWDIPDPSC